MRSLLLLCLFALSCHQTGPVLVAVETPKQETPKPKTAGQLGINLGSVSYYSSEVVFNDAFKVAKPWVSQAAGKPYGQGGPLDLDEFGNVKKFADGQFAETLIFADLDGHYPGGDYTCLYEGAGEIQFLHAAKVVKSQPGKLTVRVTPKQGVIGMQLRKTDPRNPVRKIRLLLPGCESLPATEVFHASFLKFLDGFQVIRFMDWGRINGSKVVEWKDRTTPDHVFQGEERGVAIEYMLELANRMKADPWICVPHRASDDYVARLAELVKAKLAPDRKLYLEYSNETWNSGFEQANYCRKAGLEKNYSEKKNDYEAQLRFSAKRSVEVFRVAGKVLDRRRMVRVLAPQSANPWTGTTMMDFVNATEEVDAVAIAPYFGNALGDPKVAAETAKLDVDAVLEVCRKSLRENKEVIAKYVGETSKRKLDLIAYEGGQHLAGYQGAENNDALTKLFQAANRHPKMRELYLEDLNNWKEAGGGLFCLYSSVGRYSKWGSWGLLESSDQDAKTAPKLRAVREFMGAK